MNYEEALEIITNAIQTDSMTAEQDKALAIAQKALEKQKLYSDMMNRIMFDEQIIKALECCIARENCEEVFCEFCPYERVFNCAGVMMQNAIDFINRQKARTKELEERISYLEESIDCSRKEYNRSLQKMQQLKSEAIKEFAERLKEGEVYMRIEFPNTKNTGTEDYIVLSDDIDNLVKEMTEVQK